MAGATQQLQEAAELQGWDGEAEERDYGVSPLGKALQYPVRIRSVRFRQLEGSGRGVGVKPRPFLLYSPVRFSMPSLTIWQHTRLAESPELLQEINSPR